MVRSGFFDHQQELRNYVEYSQGLFEEVQDAYIENKDLTKLSTWKTFISLIDIPGKIMGLQAYGKTDVSKVNEWKQRQQFRNMTIFKSYITISF